MIFPWFSFCPGRNFTPGKWFAEVSDAVDIIAKRISDAEAKFIEKNAEDKKKIEQIVDKVDNRIKAVTDSDKAPEEKEQEVENTKLKTAEQTVLAGQQTSFTAAQRLLDTYFKNL